MKLRISKRAEKIQPSATIAVTALARELRAAGRPVLSFSAGEPDFRTPDCAAQAARDAMERGETHYTANSGIPELKRAIASYYRTRFGLEYEPGEILAAGGAKQALYEALQTLVDDGDEVLIPAPAWVSYVEQVRLAGGREAVVETFDTGCVPTRERIEAALSPRTAGMIINSPNNPTGAVYGADALAMLADVARRNDLWIIYDEIYERLVYGEARHHNILQIAPDLRDRIIVINGVSKAYSMTGWRIGYLLAPRDVTAKIDDIQSHMSSNPSSIAQWASVGAIEGSEPEVEARRAEFERRRDMLLELLADADGLKVFRPDGAFYAFLDVSGSRVPDDGEFCRRILEEKYVALVPGEAFFAPGCARMSYACSEGDIREGAARIKDFLRG